MDIGGPIPRPKPTQRSSQPTATGTSVPRDRGSSTPHAHAHSGAEHGDEALKRTFNKVSKLCGESKEQPLQLSKSTALLLIYMFPDDLGNDNLDVRRLSKWKEIFKKHDSNPKDLQAELNKMGAGLDPNHLGRFVSSFQASDGKNISDYNTFIQCCAIAEVINYAFHALSRQLHCSDHICI